MDPPVKPSGDKRGTLLKTTLSFADLIGESIFVQLRRPTGGEG